MISGIYELAGIRIEICSDYDEVHELLAAYRSEGPADMGVSVSPEELEAEIKTAVAYDRRRAVMWSRGYVESVLMYRKIGEQLPDHGAFIFHSSAIAVEGWAYLFTAKSGTGKSTHTRLWRQWLGDRAVMINDDKPILRLEEEGGVTVYGTPYDGKHHISNQIAVPLKAICLLERDAENRIERIRPGEYVPQLLEQIYRPKNPLQLAKTMQLLDETVKRVPLYRLFCNKEPEAARVSYEGMQAADGV